MITVPDGFQDHKQRSNLLSGEGFGPGIVKLDAQRDGIDVVKIAPSGYPGLPGPVMLVNQFVDRSVAANKIIGADPAGSIRVGKRMEGLCATVFLGLVNDHEHRSSYVKVRRWSRPLGGSK